MSETTSQTAELKATPRSPRICAVSEFLDEHGAVYSFNDPLYRLGHRIGLLKPVRCRCGSWFLIENEGGKP